MSSNHDDSTSCIASDRATDGTDVVPDSGADVPTDGLGRRHFVKGLGATAASAAALGHDDLLVDDAEAVAPLLVAGAIGVAAGAVGGLAFGATFAGPNDSEVADSLEWQTHVNEFTRAREDQLMINQTLDSLSRDIQLVENKAREQAIFNVYEQGVDSGTESDATAAAEAAVNDAYATVQKSLLNSWTIRAERANALQNTFSLENEIKINGPNTNDPPLDEVGWSTSYGTTSIDLVNGETIEYSRANNTYVSGTQTNYALGFDPVEYDSLKSHGETERFWDEFVITKPDPADYSTADEPLDISVSEVTILDSAKWANAYSKLLDEHSAMMGEVSAIVSSYFTPAQNGEIDLYEAVGPQYLTDTASTAKDYQEAAMALRAMGFPISDQVVTFTLPTESGESLELTGRLSWTAHQGNTLAVGTTHNAGNIPGTIYAAVNLPDGVDSVSGDGNTTNTTNTTDTDSTSTGPGGEIVELTDEFTIKSAEGADAVSFTDRSLASSDLTQEEINQIFKDNYIANKEAEKEVHDTATGGGGWSGLNTTGKAIIVAALGALGLGAVNN